MLSSADNWELRYKKGGTSGRGSQGKYAKWKAEVLNGFVAHHGVNTVVEFGCGDGEQLKLYWFPEYTGYDVSPTAVAMCRKIFADEHHKRFRLMSEYDGETADLALSIDVIFHLLEDDVFDDYMRKLCDASISYLVIFSSDHDDPVINPRTPNTRHRKYTDWIEKNRPEWKCLGRLPKFHEDTFQDFSFWGRQCSA